jgi:hypothetical protein
MDGDGYLVRRGGAVAEGVFMAAGIELIRLTADQLVVRTAADVVYTFQRDDGWRLVRHVRGDDIWFGVTDPGGSSGPVAFTVPEPATLVASSTGLGWEVEDRDLPWWWWMRPATALLA